jgi:hypothetical protein
MTMYQSLKTPPPQNGDISLTFPTARAETRPNN